MIKETVDFVSNNAGLVAAAGSVGLVGITYLFNKASGIYDMEKNAACLKRQTEHYDAVTIAMDKHPEIKSVLIGNAENINIFVRDTQNSTQIKNATFFLNEKAQYMGFYQAMSALDDPNKILERALNPVEEDLVPRDIQKQAAKAARGWANNPIKRFLGGYYNVPDKKQELSDNILGAFKTLTYAKTEEFLIPSRSALALKYKDREGGIHMVVIPPNDLISEVLYNVTKGKQKLDGEGITPLGYVKAVKEAHASWCMENTENPKVLEHFER